MNVETINYLHDILNSISKIQIHIQQTTSLINFINNVTVTVAVERRLGIIGEAVWQITKIDKSIKVSDQQKIISLRHILIHDYDLIDKGSLWKIIETNLPLLKSEVEHILNNSEN